MAQTKEGALKSSAKLAGMSVSDYLAKIADGYKRCTRCKTWKPVTEFGKDRTRPDGIDASCFECRRVKERKNMKGRVSAFKEHQHTDEARRKMSEAHKGKPSPRKGIPRTSEDRKKISATVRENAPRGERAYNFSHGRFQRSLNDRRKPEYKEWRAAVFARDHFTCQDCGDCKGGNLRAHHIKPFAKNEALRYDVSNGVTLCHRCHELRHFKLGSIRNQRKLKRGERLWG